MLFSEKLITPTILDKNCRSFLFIRLFNGLQRFERGFLESIYTIASLWLGLAVISAVVANHIKISITLVEICVGILSATVANHFYGPIALKII